MRLTNFSLLLFKKTCYTFYNMSRQELIEYIQLHTGRGVSQESIIRVLLQAGWGENAIRDAFAQVSNRTAPSPLPDAPIPAYRPNRLLGIISTLCFIAGVAGTLYYIYQYPPVQEIIAKQFQKNPTSSQPSPTSPAETLVKAGFPISLDLLDSTPYESTGAGFTIQYPKNWRVDESGQLGTKVFFFSNTVEKEGVNPFTPNINIVSESTQGIALDTYMQTVKESLPKTLSEYALVEETEVTVNGLPATRMVSTFTQGAFHIKNMQVILVRNGIAYILTGTTLAGVWDTYKDMIESSLFSFRL